MTSIQVPEVMRAMVSEGGGVAVVKETAVPTIQDNQILVKNKAAALNPTDWKGIKFTAGAGDLVGVDYAGEIVKIGNNPKASVKVGDRVVGLVRGCAYKDRGAFAEYVKGDADLAWKIPDNMSFEDAVTFGIGLGTAVQGLFHPTRLGLVEPPAKVSSETWIFIYGGSTSVGHFAIQLAHLAGYKVATVASPRNHSSIKLLGADAVFDYRDPDVVSQIKLVSGNSIHSAFDTYSEGGSQEITVNVFGSGTGKLVTILEPSEDAQKLRLDVVVEPTWLYSIFNTPWTRKGVNYPASPEDHAHMSDFLINKLPGLIKEGKIVPMKIKLYHGLDSIHEGIKYMTDGKVSAEKIVFKL